MVTKYTATARKKCNMLKVYTPINANSTVLAHLLRISEHKIASETFLKVQPEPGPTYNSVLNTQVKRVEQRIKKQSAIDYTSVKIY